MLILIISVNCLSFRVRKTHLLVKRDDLRVQVRILSVYDALLTESKRLVSQ